ncbi:MAG: hypothetical protein R2684_05250 [Pyrinomonadaceae bacterium]
MIHRVPTGSSQSHLLDRININRQRLNTVTEQLTTGKRINRPSDDPIASEVVINLKTTRAEISHYQRAAVTSLQKLDAADYSFNDYQLDLDKIKETISGGLSDVTSDTTKAALANQLEALKNGIISFANTRNGSEYLFGGTRQDVPPFDPSTGLPAAAPADPQYVQVEPGTFALAVGVTAESFLVESGTSILDDIDAAVTALRGTGDPVADRNTLLNSMTRITRFQELASEARALIGVNQRAIQNAQERLQTVDLSVMETISNKEDTDFATAALELNDAQNALEAALAVAGRGQRSLLDYIG